MRITKLAACAIAGVLSVAVAACGSSNATTTSNASGGASGAGTKMVFGFSPYNQSAPALIGLAQGVKKAAEGLGASAMIADPNNDPTKQAQQIRTWIELKQVTAVWVLALDPKSIKPLIPIAVANHVGLLTTGKPSDYGLTDPGASVSYSIIDYTAFGKAVGAAMADCVNKKLGGTASVLYVANPAGSTGKQDEDNAVAAALTAGAPNAKIVSTIDSKNDRLSSQQSTLSAIQGNTAVNAVMGVTDEGTLGPMTAFGQAGKSTDKSCVVGAGGSDEALADVKAGKVYADVAIQFGDDMTQNLAELKRLSQDPAATGKQLLTPFKTVTQ